MKIKTIKGITIGVDKIREYNNGIYTINNSLIDMIDPISLEGYVDSIKSGLSDLIPEELCLNPLSLIKIRKRGWDRNIFNDRYDNNRYGRRVIDIFLPIVPDIDVGTRVEILYLEMDNIELRYGLSIKYGGHHYYLPGYKNIISKSSP